MYWHPVEITTDVELQPLPGMTCSHHLLIENSLPNLTMYELCRMFILEFKYQIFSIYFVFHTYLNELQMV